MTRNLLTPVSLLWSHRCLSGAEYCDDRVCLLCLSASMPLELYVRSLPIFLCTRPTSMARSLSGGVAVHVVKCRHRVCGHDTIAILWVQHDIMR